ncbi:MAG TPA: methylmalonyl Co-A mutase-associated GTPase MeaB [Elusimicrobiota bacterium]|nr:methylmalonyl Co-A mutase-associated GTPase MeaB [Elusimicrobiota bacterium]
MPPKNDPSDLIRRVRRGEQAAASRALSLVVDDEKSSEILAKEFFKSSGSAQKIGVCGPPGAGKSTLTGRLISLYRARKLKVGVLMVDPSSSISGGAFLGDRLRIMEHATDPGVFIRSLASRGMIGGLTHTIFGAIHVLEALGCGKILIETVGTGQDEVDIASVADTVLYVTTPAMGDEIQAMKAGAMEIGDIFVVNKADLAGKDKAVADLRAALGLGHSAGQAVKAWEPPIAATSALSGEGVEALGKLLDGHWAHLEKSGEGRGRLKKQHATELQFWIQRRVIKSALDRVTDKILEEMLAHKTDPASLGRRLLRN